jgi:hypothetical protein
VVCSVLDLDVTGICKTIYRFSGFSVEKTEPNRTETGLFDPVPVRVLFEFFSFSKFYFNYFFR